MRESIITQIINNPHRPFVHHIELTDDERIEFRDAMDKGGMGYNTLYQRMAYRGFSVWEIAGIDRCMSDFWIMAYSSQDEKPAMPDIENFWQVLVENGLNTAFIKYMEAHGMSRNTTIKRFSSPNFLAWEWTGIEQILRQLQS